jgi:hypothetical protein
MRAQQKIVVNTKGQLIAAFECAINGDPDVDLLETQITLIRATGKTVYNLKCGFDYRYRTQRKWTQYGIREVTVCHLVKGSAVAQLRAAKACIRKIPAKELLA